MVEANQHNPLRNVDATADHMDYPPSGQARSGGSRREVIDARGSIDSRTFDETRQISSVLKTDDDRPNVNLDDGPDRNSWHSRAGQGFNDYHAHSVHYRKSSAVSSRVLFVIAALVAVGVIAAILIALF